MTLEQLLYVAGLSVFPLYWSYRELVEGGTSIAWAILIVTPTFLVMVVTLSSVPVPAWTPWAYLICFSVSIGRFFIAKSATAPTLGLERNLLIVGCAVLLLAGLFLFLMTRRYVFIEDHTLNRIVTYDRLTGKRI